MIYEVMKYCKNFFPVENVSGEFNIVNGALDLEAKNGQYILIEGSTFNDGVYIYPAHDLQDETFDGYITLLAPPPAFLRLVEDIRGWCEKNGNVDTGVYASESFGGYSYTLATDSNGKAFGWQDAFSKKLNIWRKK